MCLVLGSKWVGLEPTHFDPCLVGEGGVWVQPTRGIFLKDPGSTHPSKSVGSCGPRRRPPSRTCPCASLGSISPSGAVGELRPAAAGLRPARGGGSGGRWGRAWVGAAGELGLARGGGAQASTAWGALAGGEGAGARCGWGSSGRRQVSLMPAAGGLRPARRGRAQAGGGGLKPAVGGLIRRQRKKMNRS